MEISTFATLEEAIEALKANLVQLGDDAPEADRGRFVLKDLMEYDQRLSKKTDDHKKSISEKESLTQRAKKAESEIAKLAEVIKGHENTIEKLQQPGETDAKIQMLTAENNRVLSENRELKAKMEAHEQLGAEHETLKSEYAGLLGTVTERKIYDALREAALANKVPQSFIDSPDFRLHVNQFEVTQDGDIITKGDKPKTMNGYIQERQKTSPHWVTPTSGAGAKPGTSTGLTGDARAANYEQAAKNGDLAAMALYSPPVVAGKP